MTSERRLPSPVRAMMLDAIGDQKAWEQSAEARNASVVGSTDEVFEQFLALCKGAGPARRMDGLLRVSRHTLSVPGARQVAQAPTAAGSMEGVEARAHQAAQAASSRHSRIADLIARKKTTEEVFAGIDAALA